MAAVSKVNTRTLVLTALFIALSLVGSYIKIFGSIAFDSLPGFLAALLIGPIHGAAIGFLGHILSALTSGFPLSLPLHLVVAVTMAITMLGFGYTFKALKNKVSDTINLALTSVIGTILNGPVSLTFSMVTLALMAGKEAAFGLLPLLPILTLASIANIVIADLLYVSIGKVWKVQTIKNNKRD